MKSYKVETISIDNLDSTFSEAWAELLLEAPQASFFSQLDYLKILQTVFKREIKLCFIKRGNKIKAGFILFIHPKFKTILTHLYYAPYNNFLISEKTNEQHSKKIIRRNRIYNSFINFLEENYKYSHFVGTPNFEDIREIILKKNWNAKLKYTFYIDVHNIETTLNNIHKEERRQIRNFNLEGDLTTKYNPEKFAELIFSSYKRHKMLPPINLNQLTSWLKNMANMSGNYFMGITNKNNELQSGLLWTEFKKTAYFLLTGSKTTQNISYSPYLFYQIFTELNNKGITKVDLLGGTQKSISLFKIHMGGIPKAHYEITYSGSCFFKKIHAIKKIINLINRKI